MRTKRYLLLSLLALTASIGCQFDTGGPVVLGVTPKLKREIRSLVASTDPDADADQVVNDYVQQLVKVAEAVQIEPTEDGDYLLPENLSKMMDRPRKEFDVVDIAEEFELDLPSWSIPLVKEYRRERITSARKRLLSIVILAMIMPEFDLSSL